MEEERDGKDREKKAIANRKAGEIHGLLSRCRDRVNGVLNSREAFLLLYVDVTRILRQTRVNNNNDYHHI